MTTPLYFTIFITAALQPKYSLIPSLILEIKTKQKGHEIELKLDLKYHIILSNIIIKTNKF